MPNINKIKLSGTSYDIQDANATKTVELTQAQYDALVTGGTVDSNTFYVITDGEMFNPSGKVDTSAFTEFSGAVETELSGKTDESAFTVHTADTTIHVTTAQTAAWNAKSDFSGSYNDLTDKPTIPTVPTSNTAFTNDAGYITSNDITGKTDTTAFTAHTADTTIHVTTAQTAAWNAKSDFSGSYNDLTDKPTIPTVPTSNTAFTNDAGYITEDAISGKADSSAVTEEISAAVSGKVDTSTFNTYSGSVETALSGKQDTLSAGTNITIVDNVISAEGGGGKAISAGTNISVTTGETADTINCTLRAANTSGTGSLKLAFLNNTNATGIYSVASGYDTIAKGHYSFASGRGNTTNNYGECAVGFNNKSVGKATSISKSSGCTLFSIGNGQGTSNSELHNAFEVRQNGDIYITLNDQDVKLQDQLGGGGSSYSAGTGIDITNDVISVTGMTAESAFTAHTADTTIHVTSSDKTSWNGAATNASNAVTALGGLSLVKLTQAEYDALATKDSNTLYVING